MKHIEITEINEGTHHYLATLQNEEVEIDMKKCVITDDRIFGSLGSIHKIIKLDLTDTPLSVDQFCMLLTNCHHIENLILTNTINLVERYRDPSTIPNDHPEIKKANEQKVVQHKAISMLGMFFERRFKLLAGSKPQLQIEDKSDHTLTRMENNTTITAVKDKVNSEKSLVSILTQFDIDGIAWRDMQKVFEVLSSWLADNTSIQSLTFSHNIDDTARGELATQFMLKLVSALLKNRSLCYLDLSANNIDQRGFELFSTLFETEHHAPVSTVNLNYNHIGMYAKNAFKTLFSSPHCTIQHFSIDRSNDTMDASQPLLAVSSIAAGLKISSNQTLLTLSAQGEDNVDETWDLLMVKNLRELLQNNHTLRSVIIDNLPAEIEALLERNRSENTIRMRPM